MTAIQNFQKSQIKLNSIITKIEINKMNNINYTIENKNEIFKTLIPLYSNLYNYFKNEYENKKNDIDYDYDFITNSINNNIYSINEKMKRKNLIEYNIISNLMNDINLIKRIVLRIPNPFKVNLLEMIKHLFNFINYNINEIDKENEEIKLNLIEIIENLYETIIKIESN